MNPKWIMDSYFDGTITHKNALSLLSDPDTMKTIAPSKRARTSKLRILRFKTIVCCEKMAEALHFHSDVFVNTQEDFFLSIKQSKRIRRFEIDFCPFCGQPLTFRGGIAKNKEVWQIRMKILTNFQKQINNHFK